MSGLTFQVGLDLKYPQAQPFKNVIMHVDRLLVGRTDATYLEHIVVHGTLDEVRTNS